VTQKYNYLSYIELKTLVQQHGVKSAVDYLSKRLLISHAAPSSPSHTYKDKGWNGWHSFLGKKESYSTPPKEGFFSYEEAKAFLVKVGFNGSKREYSKKCKSLSIKLPTVAQKKYEKEWTTWSDYLSNGNIHNAKALFIEFDEAKKLVISLGINSGDEYSEKYKTLPGVFPAVPDKIYKDKGWSGWPDFLGKKKKIHRRKVFVSFHKAKALCRRYKILTHKDYIQRRLEVSSELPSNPSGVYAQYWCGWKHFLNKKQ
jgi:hypothetical protein